jgi:hypothetical protein
VCAAMSNERAANIDPLVVVPREVVSGPLLRLWVLPGIQVRGGPGWVSTLGASSDQRVGFD